MGYKTIFHIDDDMDDIDFFGSAIYQLSKAVSCISFTDPAAALQELISGALLPDVIFLDLNMPVISGQEFLRQLKTSKLLQGIPVIILSTSSDLHAIDRLKADGALDFLTKPSDLKDLENLLRPFIM